MRCRVALLALLSLLLCLPLAAAPHRALGGDLEPREARAKLDKVRVSKAPYMRLYATFLEIGGLPLKPEKITETKIYCNDTDIEEKVEVFAYQDLPDEQLDLAVVLHLSPRFPIEVQDKLKTSVADILGQVREGDRAAIFIDDGRGIISSSLGPAGDAAEKLGAVTPRTHSSFLVSAIDRALQTLIVEGDKSHKRAILIITDGLDSETITPADLDSELDRLVTLARAAQNPVDEGYGNGIILNVVLFRPVRPEMSPSFEAVARKTQGTFRASNDLLELERDIKLAFGDLYGQLVFDFVMSVDEGDKCTFAIEVQRTTGANLRTPSSGKPVTFKKVGMTWFWIIFWLVVALIVLIILIMVIRHFLAKRRGRPRTRPSR
jgi:hypothetical protein